MKHYMAGLVSLVLLMHARSQKTTDVSSDSLNKAAREGDTATVRQIIKNKVSNKGGREYKNEVIKAGHEI